MYQLYTVEIRAAKQASACSLGCKIDPLQQRFEKLLTRLLTECFCGMY
uniref:Uncharacterized protein n=1 Tax=Parascaris equorum TaxID=6256 RepID=A0A914R9F8_PAREQ